MTMRRIHVSIFGAILLVFSITALLVLLVLIFGAAMKATTFAQDEQFWSVARILRRTVYILICIFAALIGYGLLERRKVVALYLRRFGRSTAAINPAARGGLGRSLRLVTLQDGRFNPSGPAQRDWWLGLLVPSVLLVTIVAASKLLTNALMPVVSDDNAAWWASSLIFMGYCSWVFISLVMLFICHQLMLEWNSTIRVARNGDLDDMCMRVRWMGSPWLRPAMLARRSTVVRVTDALWQPAVISLLKGTHVVIVDVTDRSEHVQWELDLLRTCGKPHVLIAQRTADSHSDPDTLCYDASDSTSLQNFRAELANAISFRSAMQMDPVGTSRWWGGLKVASHYVIATLVCFLMGYLLAIWATEKILRSVLMGGR
jgi:hypothetical protein